VIEPSLAGASEVRRCFLPYVLAEASAREPEPASPGPPNAPCAAPPLGLDLDGTLDEHRAFFATLSHLWPGKVYVITYRDSRVKAEADLARLGIRFDEVVVVNAFEQKAREIARLGIAAYFDDQDEVLRHVPEGVTVFKVRNGGNFDFEDARWLYSRKTGKSIDEPRAGEGSR
jgi:hypothetical protein